MKLLLPDVHLEITGRLRTLLFTIMCSLVTAFSYAQFDFASETEPNDNTNDSGVQTLTVATTNTTTIFSGGTTLGSDEDYWKIGRSPYVLGSVSMSIQSSIGSSQPQMWLEKRTGSYDGPLVSNTLVHPGTDQSNRAMTLSYTAANEYYLIRAGGNLSGGYNYRANFPRCDIPSITSVLSTDPTENDFTITGMAGSNSNIFLVKVNTVNSFTNPTDGYTYPTVDGTAYTGSGEQTVYIGNSGTPNVTITGLLANTDYYVKVFNYTDCGGNLKLNAGNVFTVTTCGSAPATATALELLPNNENSSYVSSITGATAASTRFVVKVNTTNSFTAPTNGATLPTANTVYGGGEQVVYAGDSATPNTLVTGLATGTEYFFKVYSANLCGGNYYFESTGVSSSITPTCSAPNSNAGIYLYAEPTNLHTSIGVVNFTGGNNADGKIIYMSDENSFTLPTTLPVASLPATNSDYSGQAGQVAIYTGAGNGFRVTTTGLSPNTTYYYAAVNYKECNGVLYFFPTGIYSQQTTCGVTSELASGAVINNVDVTAMDLESFTAPTAAVNAPDGYVIKMNTTNSFSPLALGTTIPTSNTVYGGGEQLVYSGTSVTPNLTITGLSEGTQYFFTIYGYKDCNGTPIHQQTGYSFSQFTLGLNFTPPSFAYGNGTTTLNATTTSTGALAYSLIGDTTGASLVGSDFTPSDVGTTTLRITVPADGVYQTISKDYSLNIVKGTPIITWNTPPNINVGEPLNGTHLNATANVSGTFEYYRYYNSFNGTFSNPITSGVTTLDAGRQSIYARFIPSDTNYNIGVGGTTITITGTTSSSIEITPNDNIKALGSVDPTLTSAITGGSLAISNKIWVPATREPGETEGTYVISVDQTAQAPASFDPLGTCPPGICIVGPDPDPFGEGEDVSVTSGYTIQTNTGTFTITNKEQVTITLDPFDLYPTFYNANPRSTIDVSSILVTNTGSPATPAPALNFVYSGNDFQNNSYGPSTTSPTNAGNYAVTVSVDETDPNFFGSVIANFTINKTSITINPENPQVKTYDGAPKTFDVTATGLSGESIPLGLRYDIDPGSGTSYDEAAPIAVGNYPVLITSWTSLNYNIYYNGTLTITDKTLVTVNLSDLTQQFDGNPKPVTVSSIETTPGVAATPTPTVNITYQGINGTSYFLSSTPPTFRGEYQVTAQVDAADPNFSGVANEILTIFEKEYVNFTYSSGNLTYSGSPQGISIVSITDSNDVVITPTPGYTVSYSGTDTDDIDYGPSTTPPTKAGDYTITVTIDALDPTYQGNDSYDFTINRIPITVTADAKSKTYGDADPALTYQLTSGTLIGSDALTGDLSRVAGENVGNYAIQQGIVTAGGNYTITFVSNDVTIGQRMIEVTADAKSKIYGDADPALTYQITSGNLAGSDAFVGILTRVAGENVGTYAIQQDTFTAGPNYNLTFVSNDLTIAPRAIEITADAKSKTYGDADPALTYQVTSGTLQFSDAFTGTLTRTVGEDAGTFAIQQGTVSTGSNYTLSFVSNDLTIGQRAIEITADAKNKTYGDVDPAMTYQITSGTLQFSDAFTGSLSRAAGEDAGTYAINQGTLSVGSNYTMTYVGNDLTIGQRAIEITADALNKTYGDTDPALTYQITSGSLAFSDAFTGSLTRVVGESVGNYAINQGTLVLNANYALTHVSDNLTIGQRAIEITADAKSKTYGDTDPALTYQITSGSLVGSDALTGDLSRVAGENVGNYAIQQGIVTAGGNYTITFVSNDVTIGQRAIEVTADAKSKIYGDADPALTYQITSGSLAGSDAFVGILTRVAGENVGTYAIQQDTFTAGPNYNLTFVSNDLTIAPRAIEITADTKSKTYGDADPALTYQVTSGALQFSDAFTGTLTRTVGEDTGTYAIQQGTVSTGSNYTLSFVSNDLTIGQRAIEITADAKNKTYGDADPAMTYQITSGTLQFSDAFSGSLSRAAGENIGTYAINQGAIALSSNYMLSYVGNDLTIDQRAIEITADALNKMYGDTDPALTYQITSGSLAFSDAFTGSLTRVAGENIGTYAINQGAVALNANYNLSYIGNDLTIGQRAIEVTADVKNKEYGGVDPTLTYQITSGSLAGSDAFIGILERVAGENVGSYVINQGTLALNNNYALSYIPNNLNISKRAIIVSADNKMKTYGDADSALTYNVTAGSIVAGDMFSGELTRVSGENVGNYRINQGTLTLGANYTMIFNQNTFDITPKALEITADAASKEYGNADLALTYQITSGSLINSDTLTGSLTREVAEDAGTYAINQGTINNPNYAITFISNDYTITTRNILLAPSGVRKVYGDTDPELTYTILGPTLVAGDNFTGSLTRASGEDVGSYSIMQGTLSLNSNYVLNVLPGIFNVDPRPIEITADAKSKEYGNVDPVLTYQIIVGALQFSDTFSGNLSRVAGEDIGNYGINQGTIALNANYNLSYISNDLTIGQRTIEITADAKAKTYGDADPILTYQITSGSLVGSDAFTGSLTRLAGENSGNYAIQQGSVVLNANYAMNFVSNDLTINQRVLEITADAQNKVYGDADPALTYQLTTGALQLGDAISGNLSRISGEDAGNYAIQQGTVTAGGNYSITFVANDLVIGQRTIEITADAANKIFGDIDPMLTYQVTNGTLQFSDVFSGNLSRVAGEDVGSYAIQQGTISSGNNYNMSYIGTTFTISQASQSITFNALSDVQFGDADFNLNATASSGLGVTYSSSNPTVATVSGNTVTIIGAGTTTITASQVGNGNYTAASDVQQSLTVNKEDQAITFNALANVTIGDANFNLSATASSGLAVTYVSSDPAVARISGNTVSIIGLGTTTITASQAGDANWNAASDINQALTVLQADTTAPVITLTGANPQTIRLGDGYTELGATTDDGSAVVIDNSDFIDAVGNYTIRYNATDANGNIAAEVIRTVNVINTDITAPIITLLGANPQNIVLGDGYTELGATTDDGSPLVIDASGFVDAIGSYTIRYNAIDAAGNIAIEVLRTVNVVAECPFVTLPTDNFQIKVASETCTNKNNGFILINTVQAMDYIATVNNQTYNFSSNLVVSDLAPGTYPLCIAINGFDNCEQCFELVIEEAQVLSGKTTVQKDITTNEILVEIESGTAPYIAMVNDKIVGEYTTNSFMVEVKHGDALDVSSSVACEGKISTKVSLFDNITAYPNPTKANVELTIPDTGQTTIAIEIRNALGTNVSSRVYNIINGKVKLSMENLPTGVYFVSAHEGTSRTVKIIKE